MRPLTQNVARIHALLNMLYSDVICWRCTGCGESSSPGTDQWGCNLFLTELYEGCLKSLFEMKNKYSFQHYYWFIRYTEPKVFPTFLNLLINMISRTFKKNPLVSAMTSLFDANYFSSKLFLQVGKYKEFAWSQILRIRWVRHQLVTQLD